MNQGVVDNFQDTLTYWSTELDGLFGPSSNPHYFFYKPPLLLLYFSTIFHKIDRCFPNKYICLMSANPFPFVSYPSSSIDMTALTHTCNLSWKFNKITEGKFGTNFYVHLWSKTTPYVGWPARLP